MQHIDFIPEGYEETGKEEIKCGDVVRVIVDSQFDDSKPRRLNQTGLVCDEDFDPWGYKVMFNDGGTNWFKRYHLEKIPLPE